MGVNLMTVAEMVQDRFYQEFIPRNAFFKEEDFAEDIAFVYSKMLDDLYKADKRRAKAEEGFSAAEISPDWLIEETLAVQRVGNIVFVETSQNMFSFTNDAMMDSLAYMEPVKSKCNTFVKISRNDVRATQQAPYTPMVYYYAKNSKQICFANNHCVPEKVTAYYIPSVYGNDKNCVISEAVVQAVIVSVLNLYYGMKAGMVIPKANDGNPNITLETQMNDNLKK